jgi:hypothetical protein
MDYKQIREAACPNVKNGVYLYNQFKTLDDIRDPKSWNEFWNSADSNFPRLEWKESELLEVFDKGWVKLEPLPENGTTLDIEEHILWKARSGGGEDHARLKALAYTWLKSQGEKIAMFECSVIGSERADVYGEDLACWIECGNTTADKIIDSLFYAKCNSFVVFPFVFHNMIEGYRFTATIDKEAREVWEMRNIKKKSPTKGIL